MHVQITGFLPSHHSQARQLWSRSSGVGIGEDDDEPQIRRDLARNPDTSFVALSSDRVVGTVLCGHDGRRGLLHHLAVASELRRQGVGQLLVRSALRALHAEGLRKCHLMVFDTNQEGLAFWIAIGAERRIELQLLSLRTDLAG